MTNLVFACPPRMGSTWLIHQLERYGIVVSKPQIHFPLPPKLSAVKVIMVRHPVDWLRSYWTAIHPGSTGVVSVDRFRIEADDFDNFARLVCRELPGGIGKMVKSYQADVHLRIEDAPECLGLFMQASGYSRASKLTDAAVNTSKSRDLPMVLDVRRRMILESEREYCEAFNYS